MPDLFAWLSADRLDAVLVRLALSVAGALLAVRLILRVCRIEPFSGPHNGSS